MGPGVVDSPAPLSVSIQRALPREHTQAISGVAPGSDSFCPVFGSSHTLPCGPLNPHPGASNPGPSKSLKPLTAGVPGPPAPPPHSAEQHPLSPPSSSSFFLSKPQPARPPPPLPRLRPWICSTALPQTRAARDPLGLPRPRVPGPRAPPRSRRQAWVSDDWAFTALPSGPYNRPPPRVGWRAPLEGSLFQLQPTHPAAEASRSGRTEGQTDTQTRSSLGQSPLAELQQSQRRGGPGQSSAPGPDTWRAGANRARLASPTPTLPPSPNSFAPGILECHQPGGASPGEPPSKLSPGTRAT